MNTNATPEDRITAWLLSDAPPQAPDRLLEATFEQTRRIRRRGSPLDWRIFSMMRSIAVLATAAVVVVALVIVGGGLLDRSPGVGGPPASTAPSALPSGPSPSASGSAASVGPTGHTATAAGPQARTKDTFLAAAGSSPGRTRSRRSSPDGDRSRSHGCLVTGSGRPNAHGVPRADGTDRPRDPAASASGRRRRPTPIQCRGPMSMLSKAASRRAS